MRRLAKNESGKTDLIALVALAWILKASKFARIL